MSEERKECSYPMSDFYNFEDEIPTDTRVSTVNDCKDCAEPNEFCLDTGHCLISKPLPIPHPIPDE